MPEPIICTVTATTSPITILPYSDGTVTLTEYTSTTIPALVDIARQILNTVGAVAKPYPIQIYAADDAITLSQYNILTEQGYDILTESGQVLVTEDYVPSTVTYLFQCPSVYFASRKTLQDDLSDYEIIRNTTYAGITVN